ncbi:uncharacterized protein AB675_4240 [Cyphellophora attinorum]|uniref:Uncharacterized protein n=1 Tax=Cyphellophora attinorum TaxID=1664694 RepID=A0A0N0NL00_9EURO|nr:uncharacterized protein AB675_4240 [Phialophora attinorum]KPI38608.1 hypothetical protein AB675_4240 [Phialophora attinorum]
MRKPDSVPPPMSHSPAYYPHYASPVSSSPAVPSTPRLHRPVPAHLSDRPDKFSHVPNHIKASVSSATSGSTDATNSRVQNAPQPYPYQSDLERGDVAERSRRHGNRSHSTSHRVESRQRSREMEQQPPSTVIRYVQSDIEGDDDDDEEPDHAIWILFWMSIMDPFYTLFSCLFSIITLVVLVVISPIRLCQKEWSFSTCLIRTLCPIYRKHLQIIYAGSVDNAHNFEFSPARLVLIHVLAPGLSICMAFFSWIAAVFWIFALTMGNPDGTEKRDDGRATVLMARNKWEKFLLLALRNR